ncbi:MAG: hypothetical protein GY847_07945 [Proteobacteria bacterium]|nr:hypothetical protein [Pseudomonadota bacterium]
MAMTVKKENQRNSIRAWLVSISVFVVLCALTVLVWKQQVDHQRSLLARHTDDVATQASRRLQVFFESHLRVASIFAQRWSTHESRDFSRQRFEEFASVLIQELPGYHAIGLIPEDSGPVWIVPNEVEPVEKDLEQMRLQILDEVRRVGHTVLLAPFKSASGETTFFAALPLLRENRSLGCLVVDFHTETLIDDCFHTRIQSEFHFVIKDGGEVLFRSAAQVSKDTLDRAVMRSEIEFPIGNRTWHLAMVPKKISAADFGWAANLSVPLLGFVLSVGLGVLVFLLSQRMDLFRSARDNALNEVEERHKAEAALKVSNQRYALLSRKAIAAQEEERARLSVELHDELGQILTAIRLEMGLVEKQISKGLEDESYVLASLVELTEKATDELRGICKGLRPPLLDDLGLEPAVQFLVDEFKERSEINTIFDLSMDELRVEISKEIALCTYRIFQESLTNIRRHSKATNVNISLVYSSTGLELSVYDDGIGFDMSELGAMQGWGLEGMQERASLVNGTVSIRSVHEQGTRIVFRVPIAASNETEVT